MSSGFSTSPEVQTPRTEIVTPDWVRKILEKKNRLRRAACQAPKAFALDLMDDFPTLDFGSPTLKILEKAFQHKGEKRVFRTPRQFDIPVPAQSFGEVMDSFSSPNPAGDILRKPLVPGRKRKVVHYSFSPASELDYMKRSPSRTPSPLLTGSPIAFDADSPTTVNRPWLKSRTPGVTMGDRLMQLQDSEWYDILRRAPFPLPQRSPIRQSPVCQSPMRQSYREPRRSLRLMEKGKRKVQDKACRGSMRTRAESCAALHHWEGKASRPRGPDHYLQLMD